MKWINHQIIGFGTGYLLTGELSSAIVSSLAAVAPDAIDEIGGLIGLSKHREAFHNPVYWGIGLKICLTVAYFSGRETLSYYVLVFFMGVATHLLCDALTVTGIPISRSGERRFALKLFRTGQIVEYLIAIGLLTLCCTKYLVFVLEPGRGHLNPVDLINPLFHVQEREYIHLWNSLYSLFFRGFMARFFASIFLLGALWFGFYRQNLAMAALLFSLTIAICYLGSIVGTAFWYLK